MPVEKTMDKLVALAKTRGFVYPGSEIYGGLANSWDYGPLGVLLKNNVKAAWWKRFVSESTTNVGLDSGILMNPQVWVASGHVGGFTDPLIDCRGCKTRHRADKLVEVDNLAAGREEAIDPNDQEGLMRRIRERAIRCPDCGAQDFTDVRQFNMMFRTWQGVTEDSKTELYLRPETAQGIFVNFRNIQRSTRRKIPFGVCQIGKAFRNEITPGNFIFRTREFEQMEMEFFCEPGSDLEWFDIWRGACRTFLLDVGLKLDEIRMRDHSKEELSFYSRATTDFEFLFPFGWGELWGIADRTDYDLKRHIEVSGDDLSYFDAQTNTKYVPYVIEPSLGVERMFLAILCSAYDEETLAEGDVRTVLRFSPALAPVKIAVLPLSSKLSEPAEAVYRMLSRSFSCEYDDRQSIGKRYRRQDEIGTPFCVTFDFDSLEDGQVTVRERDSMRQVRLPIDGLREYFRDQFEFPSGPQIGLDIKEGQR